MIFEGKIGVRAGMVAGIVVVMILFAINLTVGVGNAEIAFTESDCPSLSNEWKLYDAYLLESGLSCKYAFEISGSYTYGTYKYSGGADVTVCEIREGRKALARQKKIVKNDHPLGEILESTEDRLIIEEAWPGTYKIIGHILYKNYWLDISVTSYSFVGGPSWEFPFDIEKCIKDATTCAFDELEEDLKALIDRKGVIDEQPGPYRDRDYDYRERPSPQSGIYEPHSPEVSEGPDDDCFIATAAYGTPINKNINVLREFRDDVLIENYLGETFVRIYYLSSPPIADVLTSSEWMRTATRVLLITPLVYVTKTLLNSTFQFILVACLVVGLILAGKYESIAFKFLKSFGFGFLTAVIISTLIFALGYAGHSSSICAIIAAHILPIIIPVSLGVVALSLIYPSFLERQS